METLVAHSPFMSCNHWGNLHTGILPVKFHWLKQSSYAIYTLLIVMEFPGGPGRKESACQRRRFRSGSLIPWRRTCNPLQYSCLENPTDRGAWQATGPRVAKSQTRLKRRSMQNALIFLTVLPIQQQQLTITSKNSNQISPSKSNLIACLY